MNTSITSVNQLLYPGNYNAISAACSELWDTVLSSVRSVRPVTLRSAFINRLSFSSHCATHQIRVILISSVVISCLLFPAIAVYSSTKSESFSLSFDALLTPEDLSQDFAVQDIRQLWEGQDTLHVRDDSIARARCGKGGVVRLERILIHDMEEAEDAYPVLTQRALLSTLTLERRLSELLADRKAPCVHSPQGRCLVLSPLAFWDYEEDLLLRDSDVLSTLGPSRNISAHGFTVTTDMVLTGRNAVEDPGEVAYPVLTYFFPEADCLANVGHNFWLNTVEEAAASINGAAVVLTQEPGLLALEVSHWLTCIVSLDICLTGHSTTKSPRSPRTHPSCLHSHTRRTSSFSCTSGDP